MTGPDRPSGAGTFWLAVVDAGSSLADSRATAGPPSAAIRSRFVVSHPAFLPGIRTLASRNTTSMSRAREEGATVRLRAAFAVVAMPRLGSARGLGRLRLLPGEEDHPWREI